MTEESEFTGVTETTLADMGFGPRTLRRVDRLARRAAGTTYQENIDAIIAEVDWPVIIVKAADNENNLDPFRLTGLPSEAQSIEKRYRRSLLKLVDAIEAWSGRTYPLGIGYHLKHNTVGV